MGTDSALLRPHATMKFPAPGPDTRCMTSRTGTTAIVALAGFVLFLAFLAADLAWRVWVTRGGFANPLDVALLLGLEGVRTLATGAAAIIAVRVARVGGPGAFSLAATLLFAAMWYARATTFGMPGYAQERIALALEDAGASRSLLLLLFGQSAWPLAVAATALLLFALRYPMAPDPARVRDVHATGRRGMLRDVALAGTDIRSMLHRVAAAVLEIGAIRAATVLPAGIVAAVALAFGGPAVRAAVWVLLLVFALLAFAFLRTAWVSGEAAVRHRIGRLGVAAAAAAVGVVAGGMLAIVPGVALAHAALFVSSLAPLAATFCLVDLATRGAETT